jgi:hypothetical protein
MKDWEIIADDLSKAGWSWGCVSASDCKGRTIWIADAHRGDGNRFVVRADEKLSAFVELEREVLTVTFYLESIRAGDRRVGLSREPDPPCTFTKSARAKINAASI